MPRKKPPRGATKLQKVCLWSHDWDLNPGPLPYHGSALPLSYRGMVLGVGFEPTKAKANRFTVCRV